VSFNHVRMSQLATRRLVLPKTQFRLRLIHLICRCGCQQTTAKFEVLLMPFHSAPITGLDVCLRKPLFATCSIDKSVRLWNLETWYTYSLLLYPVFTSVGYDFRCTHAYTTVCLKTLYCLTGFNFGTSCQLKLQKNTKQTTHF